MDSLPYVEIDSYLWNDVFFQIPISTKKSFSWTAPGVGSRWSAFLHSQCAAMVADHMLTPMWMQLRAQESLLFKLGLSSVSTPRNALVSTTAHLSAAWFTFPLLP